MSEKPIIRTPDQAAELAKHEATIESGMQVFVEVSAALYLILEKGLYLPDYRTWADYCRGRWEGLAMMQAGCAIAEVERVKNGQLN